MGRAACATLRARAMFDLRYHVASLAAVFLALGLGIVVGAAISDPEPLADRAENQDLREAVERLNRDLDAAHARIEQQEAAEQFATAAYPAVMNGRLAERDVAVVFVGAVDQRLRRSVEDALRDADGRMLRLRALTVPLHREEIADELDARPAFAAFRGDERLGDLGRELGRELVDGGDTPLWNALTNELVQEQSGTLDGPVDAVVVIRSAKPQAGETARFLTGFYTGLEGEVPVVGAEASGTATVADGVSAIDVYRRFGFSSVDHVDTLPGKVALAVLLAGGREGHYGLRGDRALPPIEPVAALAEVGG